MNAPLIFLLAALAEAGFAIGLLLAPAVMMKVFGITPSDGSLFLARIFGAAIFSLAVLFWLFRKVTDAYALQVGLTVGVVYNVLALVLIFRAVTAGVIADSAWGAVVLHLFLTIAFAYVRRAKA